jgi:hypothetical protein
MNDLSPRPQHSPLQVFLAFLATLTVGIGLLAAVAHAGSDDHPKQCPTDPYSAVSRLVDGNSDAQNGTGC